MSTATNFRTIANLGGGGGGEDLAATLAVDNVTGGSDLVFSVLAPNFDRLDAEDNGAGAGGTFNIDGSNAGGGVFPGGDIDLTPGVGSGGGANGVVNINGDMVVTGSLTLSNLFSGVGSPETVLAAGVGAFYSRTDGAGGNSQYFKQSGAGNLGWVPAGPMVEEEFTSVGVATFVTGRAVFEDIQMLGIRNLDVYWNGVLQRQGVLAPPGMEEDYTVVFGGASATITFFGVVPPATDLITISYLPA